VPEGYEDFVSAAGKLFESMVNMELATAEEVAAVIYQGGHRWHRHIEVPRWKRRF
jgi:hypothetical protein